MKISLYTLIIALTFALSACVDLNIPPLNVVKDDDIFSSDLGINSYMARIYSRLPIEDFRYSPTTSFNNFYILHQQSCIDGEALSRDQTSSINEAAYFSDAYSLTREVNYFLQTLPKYASKFTTAKVNSWLGEAYFVRAVTYFALVKRYGGVPLITTVLNYPDQSIEELQTARSSEEDTYNLVASDFDQAISLLAETNQVGRANKYVALAFKSRAMLFAGSCAKYNQVVLFDKNNNRLCGIPADKAAYYFKLSYDAAKLVEGHYSLYKTDWKAGDKQAQFQNFVNLFFATSSSENIFVKQYHYPESVHGYDAYNVPRQLIGANGYSAECCPTLNFVEMFDGLPKDANGHLDLFDSNGKYKLFTNTMDLFATAEPRLRATVILPGDLFKGEAIEIRRGIYKNPNVASGISRILPDGSSLKYEAANAFVVGSANFTQTPYTTHDGIVMNPAGKSGFFTSDGTCAVSGFSVRKWMNPDMPTASVLENHSVQTWIEMRYAEVLLNRAEADFELYLAGATGVNYQQDAKDCINLIRDRAGAVPLTTAFTIDTVRKERRKELAFENKTWWDLKRWRIIHLEQNATYYRTLMPFYADYANKYFFDARNDERNNTYTFNTTWYYLGFATSEISKSPNIVQNPGY